MELASSGSDHIVSFGAMRAEVSEHERNHDHLLNFY